LRLISKGEITVKERRLKKLIESKLDELKTLWLEDFHFPPSSITEDIGEDILGQAFQLWEEIYDENHKKIKDLLMSLPSGKRFMNCEWYSVDYVNDLSSWIIKYKIIESLSDKLRQRIKENELWLMLLHCEYANKNLGSPEDKEIVIDGELDIETFKKAILQRYPDLENNKKLEKFLKERYAQHEKIEHRAITTSDKKATGKSENNFRKRLVIACIETAKTYFKFDRWKDDFQCTRHCKLIGSRDCLWVAKKIVSPLKCKINNKPIKFLLGCFKNKNCAALKINNSCKGCDNNYSHIGWLKKCQKDACMDGFIPEIAYLLAKMEIIKTRCPLKANNCADTECIKLQHRKCREDFEKAIRKIAIDKIEIKHARSIHTKIVEQNISPLCGHNKNANCKKCIEQIEGLKVLRISDRIVLKLPETAIEYLNKVFKKVKPAKKDICPTATKIVHEIIHKTNACNIVKWDIKMKIDYSKLYHKKRTKGEKKHIINEIIKLRGIKNNTKNRKAIIQELGRTFKKYIQKSITR
jgi:hypothetical protein